MPPYLQMNLTTVQASPSLALMINDVHDVHDVYVHMLSPC